LIGMILKPADRLGALGAVYVFPVLFAIHRYFLKRGDTPQTKI
jgi:hypothetical protein